MNPYIEIAQKLGPFRCLNALRAYVDDHAKQDWNRCVVARAWGAPGELRAERRRLEFCYPDGSACFQYEPYTKTASRLLGLTCDQVGMLAIGFDSGDLLLREALEAEADKAIAIAPHAELQEALV